MVPELVEGYKRRCGRRTFFLPFDEIRDQSFRDKVFSISLIEPKSFLLESRRSLSDSRSDTADHCLLPTVAVAHGCGPPVEALLIAYYSLPFKCVADILPAKR